MLKTYNGHLHCVGVGVGEVTEQQQGAVFGQGLSGRQVPQLCADVLHCCSLYPTHRQKHKREPAGSEGLSTRRIGLCQAAPPKACQRMALIFLPSITKIWPRKH